MTPGEQVVLLVEADESAGFTLSQRAGLVRFLQLDQTASFLLDEVDRDFGDGKLNWRLGLLAALVWLLAAIYAKVPTACEVVLRCCEKLLSLRSAAPIFTCDSGRAHGNGIFLVRREANRAFCVQVLIEGNEVLRGFFA